jgi:hypothetical protein
MKKDMLQKSGPIWMDFSNNQKTRPGPHWKPSLPGTPACWTLIFSCLLLAACGGARRLSQSKVRQEIQQLGFAQLSAKQIQVQSVSQTDENRAVAEVQIQSVFQFTRDKDNNWQVQSVRIGDRNWIDLKAFQDALDMVLAKQTQESLQKVLEGLNRYKQAKGHYPEAPDIIKLTDILVPNYMSEVIRYDAWNRQLVYKTIGTNSFHLSSLGADGALGTKDDIILVP